MNTLARQCIEVYRRGSHQGFTLTGFHFGDAAFVQGHTTDQLHVVMAHAHYPAAGFTYGGKGFGKQRIQRFAFFKAPAELRRLALQLCIRQTAKLFFKVVDAQNRLAHALDLSGVFTAEHLGCKL